MFVNVHKTIYRKRICFDYQKEYRIVLPRESIIESTNYNISPFEAEIIPIEELLQK